MNRSMYLSIPVVLIGTLILGVVGLVLWIVLLIPVMIYPKMLGGFKPADRITEVVTRRAVKSAMKG